MPSKLIGTSWRLDVLWNEAIRTLPERPLEKRDYMYASELGRSFASRYLQMHAVKYTNPPNERARRKFLGGNIWELVVEMVLICTGILKERQLKGKFQLPGMLPVSGKLDFIAGGEIDWEKAEVEAKQLLKVISMSTGGAFPFIEHAVNYIMAHFKKEFRNNPLKLMILENKAVSGFVFEKVQKVNALVHNALQLGHYVLSNPEIDEGKLIYISKDDSLMHEAQIVNSKALLKAYKDDVSQMTAYYNNSNHKNPMKTLPPKDPEIFFTEDLWRFEKNTLNVEYSNYLTLLYGYKDPEEFYNKWSSKLTSWNRVFKRIVRGDTLTKSNNEYIAEMKKAFPEMDKYVLKARKAGAFQTEEKEVEE